VRRYKFELKEVERAGAQRELTELAKEKTLTLLTATKDSTAVRLQ